VSTPAPAPAAVCSAAIPRSLLAVAAAGRADARALAREAGLPAWALDCDRAMVPSHTLTRLWQLTENALADPHLPLRIASRYRLGQLDLYDYLFTTAATLRDGMQVSVEFAHLVSTCTRVRIETQTDRETTYSCRHVDAGGRGADLGLQFCVAALCARARSGTGRPVVPVRVAFAQPAPCSRGAFTETLGARRIDFDAPATTVTFQARDLDLPIAGADPALARILRCYATTLPAPRPATWLEHVQQLLDDVIGQGSPSLEAAARRLAVSSRTLQRRLADHGTTWSAELDSARQRRARLDHQNGAASMTRLARQLGYAGPRSARRALRRWGTAR
jgi:AraC-like DNA-binding protein